MFGIEVDDFIHDSAEVLTQQVDAEYNIYDHFTIYTPTPSESPTDTITPSPTNTSSYTPTPTKTRTYTPTPSETESFTPTPSETVTITAPTPTISETKTATVTPTITHTITHPTPTPTISHTVTITHPSPTPSITITPTFAITPTPLATPTPTMTQTVTAPTETPSISMTPTVSVTSSVSLTPTMTQTETISLTPTMTQTDTMTITPTLTTTETETMTITPTLTHTMTITPTVTKTETITPTVTKTETVTITPTVTDTVTISMTPTMTQTETITITPTATKTETMTVTPTISITPTVTETQTVTITHPSPTPTMSKTITPTSYPPRIINRSDNQTHTGYLQFVVEDELQFSGIAMSYEIVNETDAVSNAKESVALIPNTLQDGVPKSRYAIVSTSGGLIPFSSLFDEFVYEDGIKTFRFTFATVQNETIQLKDVDGTGKVYIKVVLYNNGQTTEYTYDNVYTEGYTIKAPESTPTPSYTPTITHPTPTPTPSYTPTITHPTPTPTPQQTPTPTPQQTPTPTITPPINNSMRIVHKKHEHIYYDEIQIYAIENVTLQNFQICLVSEDGENFQPIHDSALQNTYEGYSESRTFLRRLEAYKRISFNNTLGTTSLPFEYVGNLKIENGEILPNSPQKVNLTILGSYVNNKQYYFFRFEMINSAESQDLIKDTWNTVFRIIHPHDIRLDNETNAYYEIEKNEADSRYMMGTSVTSVEISSFAVFNTINDLSDLQIDVYDQHHTRTQLINHDEHLLTRYVMIENTAGGATPFYIGPDYKSNIQPNIEFYTLASNRNSILFNNYQNYVSDYFTIYDLYPGSINSIQIYRPKDDQENKRFSASRVNMYHTDELSQSIENSSKDEFTFVRSFDIPDNKFADNRYIDPYFQYYTDEYRYIGVSAFDGCDDSSVHGIHGANFEFKIKDLFIQFTDGTWIGHGSKPYSSVTLNYDLKDGYQLEDAWEEVPSIVQFKQIREDSDASSRSYLLFYFDMGENNKKSIAYAHFNHKDMLASESPITPQIYATNDIHDGALSQKEIFTQIVHKFVNYDSEADETSSEYMFARNRYGDGAMEWKYMCPIQIYGLYMESERTLSSYKPRYLMLYAYPQLGDRYFGITQIAFRTTKGEIVKPANGDYHIIYNAMTNTDYDYEVFAGERESHPFASTHNILTDNKHRYGEYYAENSYKENSGFMEETFAWTDDAFTGVNIPSVIMQIDLGENYDERPDVKDILIYTNKMWCMIAPGVSESDVSFFDEDFDYQNIHGSSVVVEMIFVEVSNFASGPYAYDMANSVFPTIIDYGPFYMPTTYFLSRENQYRKEIPSEKALELSNRTQEKNKVIQVGMQNLKNRKKRRILSSQIEGNIEGNIDGNVEV